MGPEKDGMVERVHFAGGREVKNQIALRELSAPFMTGRNETSSLAYISLQGALSCVAPQSKMECQSLRPRAYILDLCSTMFSRSVEGPAAWLVPVGSRLCDHVDMSSAPVVAAAVHPEAGK